MDLAELQQSLKDLVYNNTSGETDPAITYFGDTLGDIIDEFVRTNGVEIINLKGSYDALLNIPNLDVIPTISIKKGDAYKVIVAGTFFTKFIIVGTLIVALKNNANSLNDWLIIEDTSAIIIDNQGANRVITATSVYDRLYAQNKLLFDGDQLSILADARVTGIFYINTIRERSALGIDIEEVIIKDKNVNIPGILSVDIINEYILNAGITFNNKIITNASTISYAGFRVPHGIAPISPIDGDIWTSDVSIYARINGSTIDLADTGVNYWQRNGINLSPINVGDDISTSGKVLVNTINENTLDYGVVLEGVLFRDKVLTFGTELFYGGGTEYGDDTLHETFTYNGTTNIVIGNRLVDGAIIINYTAKRGSLYQQGEIILLNKTSTVDLSHIWDLDDIGLTVTGDTLENNLRLNMIVDNSSANDILFNYVGEVVALDQVLLLTQIWKDESNNLSFKDEITGTKTLAELAFNGIEVLGTPLNNQIAVWTDFNTLEGTSNLTYNESWLYINGYFSMSSFVDIRSGANKNIYYDSTNEILRIGYLAGNDSMTGSYNYLIGKSAGYTLTTGSYNVAIGVEALYHVSTGQRNVAIGYQVLFDSSDSISDSVIIGYRAGYNAVNSCIVCIGSQAGYYNVGTNNLFIGYGSGSGINTTDSTGSDNVGVGLNSLFLLTTGQKNVAIGECALEYNSTGSENTAIGYISSRKSTTGGSNTSIGKGSLAENTIGVSNVVIGSGALLSAIEPSYNVVIGTEACGNGQLLSDNTIIGYGAFLTSTGSSNTGLGYIVGYSNVTGSRNVFIGNYAGYYETGSDKLFIDSNLRSSESDARVKALVYGIFDSATISQLITFNANVYVRHNLYVDTINEFTSTSGITFGHRLITPVSTTSYAGLRIPHGDVPTSPINGDIWTTTTSIYARINGSTVDLGGGGSTYTFRYSLVESSNFVNLVNDADVPGNSKLYGTNVSGVRGWYDIPTAGTPDAHATTHENNGSDEISVAGLSGLLADSQTPLAHVLDSSIHTISGKTAGQILLATAATTYGFTTVSGDITINGSGVTVIGSNKVTLAMMTQMATSSFLGRVTVGSGNVEVLTATQATSLLNIFSTTSTTKGLVTGSNNLGTTYYLRADGTWAVPPAGGTPPVDSTLLDWSTDRYQAYAAKGTGGELYTGTTDPTAITRLNYNGYFYASRLYTNNIYAPTSNININITAGVSGTITLGVISGNSAINLGDTNATVNVHGTFCPDHTINFGYVTWGQVVGYIYGSGGYSGHVAGYDINVRGGSAYGTGNNDGGNLYLYGGVPNGAGVRGGVYLGDGTVGSLPVRTSETNMVYYNPATGKLSYGTP